MSKQLTDEEARCLMRTNNNKRGRYNWFDWLDGNWHQIIRGVDYECSDKAFRNLVYLQKKNHGSIRALKIEDGFLIKKVGWECTLQSQKIG